MRAVTLALVAAALVFGSGCVRTDWIDRTLVTVDVTGTWYGSSSGGTRVAPEFFFELKQEGSKVTGSMRTSPVSLATSGPIDGTVAGDKFTFTRQNGNVEGQLTVSGEEMTGRVFEAQQTRPLSLRRVDPPPRPGSPPR
jgi:hypothetical protein